MVTSESVTYRSVLANREFAALVAGQGLSVLGDQLARIAIAVLVYDRTGSAFAASATYAVSYLVYLLGGPILSALSDRNPRVTVMVLADLLRAPLVLALCLPGLPLWSFFVVLAAVGALAPPFDAARSALQPEMLPGEQYVMGNAVMNIAMQLAQTLGFVAGGAVVALVSARGALALDAATFLVSAGLVLGCVRHRPAAQQAEDRSTLLRDTAQGLRMVSGHRDLRRLLTYALLGSAAVIAPEGLAVPVAHALGGDALAAGVLTATVPAGFLVGSAVVLRVKASQRERLLPWLTLLGCVPLVMTPAAHSITGVALLWFLAGAGGCVNLIASSVYVQTCPREFRSRAYGVAVTSLYAVQGAVLLLAGALAGYVTPQQSVAVVAVVTMCLLALRVRATNDHNVAQEDRDLDRTDKR